MRGTSGHRPGSAKVSIHPDPLIPPPPPPHDKGEDPEDEVGAVIQADWVEMFLLFPHLRESSDVRRRETFFKPLSRCTRLGALTAFRFRKQI